MADLSDPKIDEGERARPFFLSRSHAHAGDDRAAYQDVRADKTDTNWLLLDYEVRAPDPRAPRASAHLGAHTHPP